MFSDFALTAIVQGIAFAGLGCGIYLSLRIFRIPDITTDGSYTLGGILSAIALSSGMHPIPVLLLALLGGGMAGASTGIIHTRLDVNPLLSGILVMTALYSVNLILAGRPNLPLNEVKSIFQLSGNDADTFQCLLTVFLVLALLLGLLYFLLITDFGIGMRATGNNETMAAAMGIHTQGMKIIGLALANACTALSGSLICQYQGFADINMGIGIVISGLGAVMMGETLLANWLRKSLLFHLLAIALGCILFRLIIAGALYAGTDPNYLRLLTALIVLGIVFAGKLRKTSST
jgi:putative ABC transport system permease protein